MNAEDSHPEDEAILTHLLACDEALAAGTPPRQPSNADTPLEYQPRLQGDMAFIQVLRQVLSRRVPGESSVPASEPPLEQLGRFQIRRRLGQGSFGMVFLASDPQLGREVALKVPRPEVLLTGELRERFLREARAAAGLDHPNLVPVYEAGAVGPLCYIASAYCPGITLSDWFKERAELAPERLAAALVATLADAVGHAHTRGVIHRDLKPSNVLLQGKHRDLGGAASTVKEPGEGRRSLDGDWDFIPRITDFGLAKITTEATSQPGLAETHSGAVLGTPNYMAPEQASGKNREIGPAADVYALGAILYELLTGRPPFRGETILDTLEQVRTREPLPPGRLRPQLSRDLETISLKCLQKEPRKRYESAAALADDLRRYLAGEPIRARPVRAWERGLKWARRKPTQAALLAVCILGPILLATVVLAYDSRLRQSNKNLTDALETTEEKRQEANNNLRLAGLAIENFATKLGQDKRLLAHNLEDVRKEYLQSAMDMWRKLLEQRPEDPGRQQEYARTLQRFGWLIKELGAKQEAIDAFQKAVGILKEIASEYAEVPQYRDEQAEAFNSLAGVYADLRRSELAETAFLEARKIRQQLASEYPTERAYQSKLANNHNNLALLYEETGRSDLAEKAHLDARDIWAKLLKDHPKVEEYRSGLVDSCYNLGLLYEDTSRLELAEKFYGQSCDLARELVHEQPAIPIYKDALGKALTNLGLVYVETNRAAPALKAYGEAQSIYQKLADAHPKMPNYRDNLARVHHNQGQAYQELGQTNLAEGAYGKACDLRRQLMRDYPTIADYRVALTRTLSNLGNLFCDTGRPKEARAPLEECRSIREQLVHDHPAVTDFRVSLGKTYSSLGLMEMIQGHHQVALDWLDQSVRILESVLKKEPRQTFARQFVQEAYQRRVTTLNQLGRYADSLSDLDRLLELAGGVKSDPWRLLRAVTLARMGQPDPAMTEVDALAARPSLSATDLYDLACVCSLCSAAIRSDAQLTTAERDRRADPSAARAVEFLKKAKAAGFFKSAAQFEEMRKDKDLDVLRGRQDFQELFPLSPTKDQPKKDP
jgi:serine/threonine protein kinase